MREFFAVNQTIVLFVYGQVFFVLGLAIAWQSRRRSRLTLARSLVWLGAFGLAHGLHEWGDIFIPIQAEYLEQAWIDVLLMAQTVLLTISLAFLMQFGVTLLSSLDLRLRWLVPIPGSLLIVWMAAFLWVSQVPRREPIQLVVDGNVWARYLFGFCGALLAAIGLWNYARQQVQLPGYRAVARNFQIAAVALVFYAFLAGLIGPPASFFPASVVNDAVVQETLGVPVQLLRSLVGLVLAVVIVRGLIVFDLEIDRRLDEMEGAQVLSTERERISRELHDGAIQTVYSAGLIAESVRNRMVPEDPLAPRVERIVTALQQATSDLRHFITQLEPSPGSVNLVEDLRRLAADPYLQSLVDVSLDVCCEEDGSFSPARAAHVIAIANEALSNVARHAHARHVWITVHRDDGQLTLAIADDGVGYASGDSAGGFGLRNMRDRARLLGGTLTIEPRAARGTVVTVKVPWEDTR